MLRQLAAVYGILWQCWTRAAGQQSDLLSLSVQGLARWRSQQLSVVCTALHCLHRLLTEVVCGCRRACVVRSCWAGAVFPVCLDQHPLRHLLFLE